MLRARNIVLILLILLLPVVSHCRAIPMHRKGWGSKLDWREQNVQQFVKHNGEKSTTKDLPKHGSGIYYKDTIEFGYEDDSEPDDSIVDEEEKELKLQSKAISNCVHPKTHQVIELGSFDFDEKSCLMCECPSGKIKCYNTC